MAEPELRPRRITVATEFGHTFPPSQRQFKNNAEGAFADAARKNGWAITKRGWPDFIAFKDGELIVVEVKPTVGDHAKIEQRFVTQWLADNGIKVFFWNPVTGFRRIKPRKPPP